MRPGSGVHDIPHLRLPIESGTVETGGQGVVRMDLDGQVSLCVNEFEQQREDIGRSGIDLFSDKPAFELLDELRKAPSIIWAALDNGFVTWDSGHFPALADVFLLGFDTLEGNNLFSTPDEGFQYRFEFKYFHRHKIKAFSGKNEISYPFKRRLPSIQKRRPRAASAIQVRR